MLITSVVLGQSLKQEKMQQLDYLVGEWIGTSSLFENGVRVDEIPAFESICYDLNGSILVIRLNSVRLNLHTVIYYDEEAGVFQYNAFSENGGRTHPARFMDGRLIVEPNETKRFVFEPHGENGFREYGEELINGKWVKYFEDIFSDTR